MDFKKLRDLDIAKNKFNFSTEISEELIYVDWVGYIESHSDYFTWREKTKEGEETLSNINKVPESFREGVLLGLNKIIAYAEFNQKKNLYDLNVGFVREYKRIRISFERKPNLEDLKRFLEMANYLDALLLVDGTTIIDEKMILGLE